MTTRQAQQRAKRRRAQQYRKQPLIAYNKADGRETYTQLLRQIAKGKPTP